MMTVMIYGYLYLKDMLNDQSGQSMTEYAVILGLIMLATVGSFTLLGGDMLGMYDNINKGVDSSFEANTWFNG